MHFDFGLTAAQEARAAALHRESIIVDLLSQGAGGNIFAHYPQALQAQFRARMAVAGSSFDRLAEALFWPYELSRSGSSHLIRDWLVSSGVTCITHDIPVYDGRQAELRRWDELAARYDALPWLRYVTNTAEIRQAKRDRVIASYAFWQPFIPTVYESSALDRAHEKGLRSFMLTYNWMDRIGVGCTERVDAGLSTFGVEVVRRCNEIGIVVDVSHCGPLTTLDACRHSKEPVNANHTAARAVYAHARAKSDQALRAIADTGGVIGVVALPFFLSGEPRPTIEHMLDHIDYIAALVGWQHVALGTDWPMQAPDDVLQEALGAEARTVGFREEDRFDVTRRLIGFDDCRDLPNITRGLVKRGYGDEQIRGILGENALRVFAEVWD
jgi:membrane dipeptidase